MAQQGRLLAAALSARGVPTGQSVVPILDRLNRQTLARIRVYDASGSLVADSSALGPRLDSATAAPEPTADDDGVYQLVSPLFRDVVQDLTELLVRSPTRSGSSRIAAAASEPAVYAEPNPDHAHAKKNAGPLSGAGAYFFGSGGALCTLARSNKPLIVLNVPLVAA